MPPKQPSTSSALATPSRFYISQDYKLLGESFHVTDGTNLVCVADLKAFAIKSQIAVYRDEAKTQPAFQIQQKSMLAMNKAYAVTTATGEPMAELRLQSMQSLMSEHWEIADAAGQPVGTVEQDATTALIGRVAGGIMPQKFIAKLNGQPVCRYSEELNIGISFKMDIDFSDDPQGVFDRTLGIAIAILLASRHTITE